jgi:hypothetical protein
MGVTLSSDFPTQNPLQPGDKGSNDAFVAKIAGDLLEPWFTWSSSSAGGTKVQVSTNGNLLRFTSPTAKGREYEHIHAGGLCEGYVLSYTHPNSGASVTAYDVGGSESGFGLPTNTLNPPKVVRKTSDGVLQLRQYFVNYTARQQIDIQMIVRNLSSRTVSNVILRRQVDYDVDTGGTEGWASSKNTFLRSTADGVMAWNEPSRAPTGKEAHGMLLRVIQRRQGSWEAKVTANPLDVSASPTSVLTPVLVPSDYGATLQFNIGTLAPGQEVRVDIRYMRF